MDLNQKVKLNDKVLVCGETNCMVFTVIGFENNDVQLLSVYGNNYNLGEKYILLIL